MQKRQKLLNFLYEEMDDDAQKRVLQYAVKQAEFEDVTIEFNHRVEAKAQVVPVPEKNKRSHEVNVNNRTFPSFKKACDFYQINVNTARKLKGQGIPMDEIFSQEKEKEAVIRRQAQAHH